ncbi:MAG: GH36-type glycosyl hydrolase domain-containing protein [Gemmatimonadaceae bacterium]
MTGLACFNGLGGFNSRGEYEIRLDAGRLPPAPWINVIANPDGGFIASESGCGPTWAVNSSFFRLTPWENDPVSDPIGECLYLRDEDTCEVWNPTPAPMHPAAPYTVRHGHGYSVFEHQHGGIATSLRAGVPESGAVKIQVLTLTNNGQQARRLSLTTYVEWVLGTDRERSQGHLRVETDIARSAIFASNGFEADYAGQVAFSALSEPASGYTTDRRSFLGRNGSVSSPAGLSADRLGGDNDVAVDPCAVLSGRLDIGPGETREVAIVLGAATGLDGAIELIGRYANPAGATKALDDSVAAWRRRLDAIHVTTPDPAFDLILNGWSLYQALACRMWGRIALYQSSGAYGFRDQLQDSMALVYSEASLARDQIVRAASRQFEEGDVQHWWHPDTGRGVRTRFADDLIWLAFVTNHYVRVTGDSSVLDEITPYVKSRLLLPGEDEIYGVPDVSDKTDTVYDHCVKALRRACTAGAHGLPLIGGGDWNDGMNRVGIEAKGESVWLAWFLIRTLREFIEHSKARGDNEAAQDFMGIADSYREAVERTSWDGQWYRRAFYDDGTPLGSSENLECRIDAIAQSWSVISGAGDPERQRIAMKSFNEHLVREDARLIMLLTPPFDRSAHDPGYIQGYLPGVRENGAQYTHAALWSVLAESMLGHGDRAFELFQMINPITHALTEDAVATYKVEPYVVAADVYTAQGHVGRGGWTWYTGSASWLYRVGLESILGFVKEGDTLRIEPCIPAGWKEFSLDYTHGSSVYAITVRNPRRTGKGAVTMTVDGAPLEGPLALVDDGTRREVLVELAGATPRP